MRFGVHRHTLILALVLLYTAGFRLVVLDRPFGYDMEGATASEIGISARNYLRFDWTQTGGMPVLTVGQLSTAPIVLNPDHPPLIPLLVAAFYAGFGVGEWQTRLPISIMLIAAPSPTRGRGRAVSPAHPRIRSSRPCMAGRRAFILASALRGEDLASLKQGAGLGKGL